MLLTMEERGQYITLLAVMHQQGRLSIDEVEAVIKKRPSQKLATKFKIDENGLWFNERLEEETIKRKRFTESRKNSLDINNSDLVNIYILHDPMSNHYKIGSSKYPLLRLSDMQKKNPAIYMYWVSPIVVVRSIEKDLHIEFKPKKFKNDWFKLTLADLESIIDKKEFRTDINNESRTDSRTEDVNENEIQVFGNKKELFVSVRKVFAHDRAKLIYDLRLYFSFKGQLESLKSAGMDKFDEFMQSNPANGFDDDGHLYNAFRKFCLTEQINKKTNGKKKFTIEDLNQ